uniref:C-type lectin domain-containing protein n=1 Tax=Oryzias latipes TaxID=8090 RepID=A0A3B3H4D6_ORYLA
MTPDTWQKYETCFCKILHEYHYVDQNMNWTEAQQHCRKEYTDLATVSTMADLEKLGDIHSKNIEIWIGLFKKAGTNVISHWSLPGLQFNESQAKWKIGEPNGVTSETCGAIEKITEKQWLDMSCIWRTYIKKLEHKVALYSISLLISL